MLGILHTVYKINSNSNSKLSINSTNKLLELKTTTIKVNNDNFNLISTPTINNQLVLDLVLDHN